MTSYTLSINGLSRTVTADEVMPLLWALREQLKMTGTKYGCGVGACLNLRWACTAKGEAVCNLNQ